MRHGVREVVYATRSWLRRSTRNLAFFLFFALVTLQLRPGGSLGGAQYNLPRADAERRTEQPRRAPRVPNDSRTERPVYAAAKSKSKHKPYEAPSPSELDDDEYATNPPNLGFFSTGGGASANRRFSTTGI